MYIKLKKINLDKYLPKNMDKKMFMMLVSCAIFFGAIFGYKLIGKVMMNLYFNNMPMPAATITTAKVKQYTWPTTLAAIGTVQAINSAEVTTEAAGIIEAIKFKSGDNIAQGDILITLNSKVDLARLAAAKAAMNLTMKNLARAKQLIKEKSIAKSELDAMQSQADQAISQVAMQQEFLAQKIIRAPFAGCLGIRKINLGEYISPGSAIVNLQSLAPIYVNFSIPEQELYNLKIGLNVDIKVSALENKTFTGKITAIEPGADPTTRNFNVQATFANKDLQLRPGMFADVTVIMRRSAQVIAIPRSAISYNPYGNSVYVVYPVNNAKAKQTNKGKNGKDNEEFMVKKRFVKLGYNNGDFVTIMEGLITGDVVATSGLLKLRNDAKVVINNAITPSVEAGI